MRLGEGGFLDLIEGFAGELVVEEVFWSLVDIGRYLGQEAEPEDGHLALGDALGLELLELDESEVETLDYLVAMEFVDDVVVVDELIGEVGHEDRVDKVERVDGLEELIARSALDLAHESL